MKRAEFKNGLIYIGFSFPKGDPQFWAVKDLVAKELPESKFNSAERAWTCMLTPDAIRKLQLWDFELGPNIRFIFTGNVDKKIEPSINVDLYPFQRETIALIEKFNGRALLADQMGCISGEMEIIINRGGKGHRYKLKNAYTGLKQLRDRKNWNWNLIIPSFTRSLSLDNKEFRLNEVIDIIYQGKRPTYVLKTENHTLRLTNDHIIPTLNGEKSIETLSMGEIIFTNGTLSCPICGTTKNLITYKYAKFFGYCKECLYRKLRKNGNFKTGESTPKNKNDYIRVTNGLLYHPNKRTDGIEKHRLIYEAYLNGISYKKWMKIIANNEFKSDHIFLESNQIIHHINGNCLDNRIENLILLSKEEHQKIHGSYKNFGKFFIPKKEKIISIKYFGMEDVYDIKMKSPNNTFIVNGIVVHNCGKTIESLGWIGLHQNLRPVLIVCPATIKIKWFREIQKCLGEKNAIILNGTTPYPISMDNDFLIINYDIIRYWVSDLKKTGIKVMVLDEGHYVKNSSTKRTKATLALGRTIDHILALSGTPIESRPAEFWTILNLLRPDIWRYKGLFERRYCDKKIVELNLWNKVKRKREARKIKDITGSSNEEELHDILAKTVMIRHLKKDVLPELPPKTVSMIPIDITNRKDYKEAEKDIVSWIRKNIGAAKARSAARARAFTRIEKLKQIAVQGKLNACVDWIKDFLASGEKLVVFCVHHDIIDSLMDEFCDVAVKLDGRDSLRKKQKSVDWFQTDDAVRLFVGNIKAAGIGHDLTAASDVCFLEFGWTPSDHAQASDRCHRIGQKDNVTVWYLIAQDTVEEYIAEIIDTKQQNLDAILDGKKTEKETLLTEILRRIKCQKLQ